METDLSRVAPGAKCVVTRLPEGRFPRRLMELGIVPGAVVLVKKRAPLGDPMELGVMGTSVAIRAADAARIRVRVWK